MFYLYIVSNRHRTVLYTGVTGDLIRRSGEHAEGSGSRFASTYRAGDLVYFEQFDEARDAIAREKQVKRWSRSKKLALIRTENPDLATIEL
jgi:putative endonuclease